MTNAFGNIDMHTMFPVPLMMTRVGDFEALNTAFAIEAQQRRSKEKGVGRSNRYGWHSDVDFFKRKEPAHARLAAIIRSFIDQSIAKAMPGLADHYELSMDGWVNISPTHAMNAPHDHSGVFWSGTYYVVVPMPDDANDKLSGAIEFIDPRGSLGSNAHIETPFTRNKFTVRPAPGTILLWPGYVKHWVHPNQASDDRMTVSFNAWFTRA